MCVFSSRHQVNVAAMLWFMHTMVCRCLPAMAPKDAQSALAALEGLHISAAPTALIDGLRDLQDALSEVQCPTYLLTRIMRQTVWPSRICRLGKSCSQLYASEARRMHRRVIKMSVSTDKQGQA